MAEIKRSNWPMVWPYDEQRAMQFEASGELITKPQLRYIESLSARERPRLLEDILNSVSQGCEVKKLRKGDAMYVIKCLKGEIQPVAITPSMLRQIGITWEEEL